MFLMFTLYLTTKTSQTSLDNITTAHTRSTIISIAQSAGDLTIFVILLRFKRVCQLSLMLSLFLTLFKLTVILIEGTDDLDEYFLFSISALLRYLSEISYGIVLIWSISAFPTIIRARCCSMVMCGCALGSILAYSIKNYSIVVLLCCTFFISISIFLQKFIELNWDKKIDDTLSGEHYD